MPSKQPDSSSKRPCIDLRLQARHNTVDWEVYSYLTRNSRWSSKQGRAMLSQAVQDYWLAYARQDNDPDLAKTTALACIERMEYQIAKLRRDFQLERSPAPSSPDRVDLKAAILELLSEVRQIPLCLDAISTALTNGGITTHPAAISNLLTESETVEPEPNTSHSTKALDEFLKENSVLISNLAEDLGLS